MMTHSHVRALFAALAALAAASASAEIRMQVSAATSPVYSRPSADAERLGQVSSGEILFVIRTENGWAAVSPPDRFGLWLNRDFIEGNRVLARTIQVRAGPGIQHDVVGTLRRGDAVMPRSEEGDWRQIAPPSSAALWVRQADLSEVKAHTEPIREVAPVPKPAPADKPGPPTAVPEPPPPPKPVPRPEPEPSPPSQTAVGPPTPAPVPKPVQVATVLPERASEEKVIPTPKITPSAPQSSESAFAKAPADKSKPVPRPVPEPDSKPKPVPAVKPATAGKPASPALKPATAIPAEAKSAPEPRPEAAATSPAHKPALNSKPAPVRRAPAGTSPRKAFLAPASTVKTQRSREVAVEVDDALVEDLNIDYSIPRQGQAVQVEGELRSAPFLSASPSRYRLLAYDGRVLEMVCHVHGDSARLRQYIGKGVSIRGSEYWVEESDMPVVVVGQIMPLATVANEPVMF